MTAELLTAEQLAERLSVRVSTIKRWSRTGKIPHVRISHQVRRFDWESVVKSLKRSQ